MAGPLHFQTTVGTSAVLIGGTQHPGFILINTSAVNTLYLGGTGVTTSNGFPISPGQTFSPGKISHERLSAKVSGNQLFGIATASPTDVRVLVVGPTD